MWQYNYGYSDELYHHGILGMKWGVRRFQAKNGKLTASGKKRYSDDSGVSKDTKKTKTGTSSDSQEGEKKKGLTDKQKKLLIAGAAVAGTALAVYGGYKLSQMYKGSGSKIDPATGFRLLNKPETDSQCLQKINPGRVKIFSHSKNVEIINGSSANCMLCTTSYDLRKRGYDVHAGLTNEGYLPDELFGKIYKNYQGTEKLNPSFFSTGDVTYTNLTNKLKNMPDGSRGNLVVWWDEAKYGGGGHSMIWENKGGNILFKDGQTDEVYKNFGEQILANISKAEPLEILRTDNLELNVPELKKVINTDTLTKTYIDHGGEIVSKAANDPIVQTIALAGGVAAISAADKHAADKLMNSKKGSGKK